MKSNKFEEHEKGKKIKSEVEPELYNTVLEIVRKALDLANVPSSLEPLENRNSRWSRYHQVEGEEISLTIVFSTAFGDFMFKTGLVKIAIIIHHELSNLAADKNAHKILLEDKSTDIVSEAVGILSNIIRHLPIVFYHSYHQTLHESVIDYIRKEVEPELRETWEEQGKSRTFSLVEDKSLKFFIDSFPDTKLKNLSLLELICNEFSIYRKRMYLDRKVWLNSDLDLLGEYEKLRAEYGKAKKVHKKQKIAFYEINKAAIFGKWNKHWENYVEENFLHLQFCNEINNFQPSELSCKQLGFKYSYSPEYINKLIKNVRKEEKSKKSK